MSDLTRAEVIRILENEIGIDIISADAHRAIEYAIASLKTDEAYDIIYEELDFIEIPDGATNGDIIKAMFPNGHECKHEPLVNYSFGQYSYQFCYDWWNSPYRKEN